jgi:guanosine-3',5'-bis(diphosphate) 3'-pyrophosphohydrolase
MSAYPPVEELEKELLSLTGNNKLIKTAIDYAKEKHKEQTRKTGEPYIVHPLWVAKKLAEIKMDIPTIAAGILHDTLEDTSATEEEIKNLFGDEVLKLVKGVTKLDKHKFRSKDEAQAENFRKLLLATAEDIRTLIIKLVDRLDNIRTLGVFRRDKQVRIARETLLVYAPLAHLLGMWEIKSQLEDISFKYLYPSEYEKVKNFVGKAKKELEEYLKKYVIPPLKKELERYGIKATIKYRSKHLYSIWEKTKRKGIALEEVHDILGVRIITNSELECYTALGIVHKLWKPVAGKFKDYITMPKPNLYQSLHTTVVGPKGRWVEFQIRTWDMHYVAEMGVAAHWAYKQGKKLSEQEKKITQALRNLVETLQSSGDAAELYKNLRQELEKTIFVYTPKGDVIALPKGSTPVDFAYAIHTEVGNHCAGAKVNGRIVPLDYELKTGEKVEIITLPDKKPSPEWLKFVKTTKARQRIKHFLKKEAEKLLLEKGKQLWRKLSDKYELNLEEVLKTLNKDEKTFFLHLAQNKLNEKLILKLLGREEEERKEQESEIKEEGILSSEELKGIQYRLAKCCYPLPGEIVKAVIQKGKGLVIHSANCPNLKNLEKVAPEKVFTLRWEEKGLFPVKLVITAKDRVGILSDIAQVFAKDNVNIVATSSITKGNKAYLKITGLFKDKDHLTKLVQDLKQLEDIEKIEKAINF